MRDIRWKLLGLGLLLSAACDDNGQAVGTEEGLESAESEVGGADAGATAQESEAGNEAPRGDAGVRQQSDAGGLRLTDGGRPAINLMCPRGGDTAPSGVVFGCDRITVVTCKDLSNVVIEFADGSRQRVQGLRGHQNVFVSASGRTIVGVWVKAGDNRSGDGPGYGERFNAPAGTCTDGGTSVPPVTPPGQTPPSTPPSTPPQTPPTEPPPSTPPQEPPAQPPSTPPQDPPPQPPPSDPPNPPGEEDPEWVD